MNIETWMPVLDFPDYEISDCGQIRLTVDHRTRKKGQYLKPTKRHDGYFYCHLLKDGKKCTKYIHQLVLEAFVGKKPGFLALHKDGNASNSCLSNLYWGTVKDNALDRSKHGTYYKGKSKEN